MLKQCKVLYVEDEPDALEELTLFLKRRVGVLMTAQNGAEGLEVYQKFRPDLVITDLHMPEMSGLEMLARIREMDRSCRFVVVSALSDAQTILEAIESGIARYVIKPAVLEDLLAVLEQTAVDCMAQKKMGKAVPTEITAEIEQRLKGEFAAFLKARTGKGPLSVRTIQGRGRMEFIVEGSLTLYEQTVMSSNRNSALVGYLRSLFWQECRLSLEKLVAECLGVAVRLGDVQCRPERNMEKIVLHFVELS